MSETGLVQIIEGALLAAGKPMTVAQRAELFDEQERPENALIRETLKEVAERCDNRGFELIEVASGFRFQVRQSLSPWVARLWQERPYSPTESNGRHQKPCQTGHTEHQRSKTLKRR